VLSCSNDTTIKLWELGSLSLGTRKRIRSRLTLNDDYDYVRSIAYSSLGSVLFSAAENGIVRKWDIAIGKSTDKRT